MNTKPDVEGVVYTFFDNEHKYEQYVFFFTDTENTLKILHRILSSVGESAREYDCWPAMPNNTSASQVLDMLKMCDIHVVDITEDYNGLVNSSLLTFAIEKYNVYARYRY